MACPGYNADDKGGRSVLSLAPKGECSVNPRVLISESDWRLLEFAYGDLRQQGYEVIVESVPIKAMEILKQWQPQVVIACTRCLGEWDRQCDGWLETVGKTTTVLVTASTADSDCAWQVWADRGCEVLFKPLVHASELRVATDYALRFGAGLALPRAPASQASQAENGQAGRDRPVS